MDAAGQKLLPRPGFTHDQRGGVATREDHGGTGQRGLERFALTNHCRERLVLGALLELPGAFARLAVPLGNGAERVAQQLQVLGQGEVVSGAAQNQLSRGAPTRV
ncbi:MAG: hypothetical protein A2W29_06405 [Gemmatimonadetes bacterium RBG_16_66_8]|nr:MAG: hypothetical protein A2W29_06405 [Gemmatimonadetes bacterium RBG_16_66_8]